jgi:hypothetical protein
MSKRTIIIFLVLFPAFVFAEVGKGDCPDIDWITPTRLSFYYYEASPVGGSWLYAKAFAEQSNHAVGPDQKLSGGQNLIRLPYSEPTTYEIPPNSRKIIIYKSPHKLAQFSDAALITPAFKLRSLSARHLSRNVNNLPQPLPKESDSSNFSGLDVCQLSVKGGI